MRYTEEHADMVRKTLARKAEKRAQNEKVRRAEALLKAKEIALLLIQRINMKERWE